MRLPAHASRRSQAVLTSAVPLLAVVGLASPAAAAPPSAVPFPIGTPLEEVERRLIREQPRPVAELCANRLPFVTPGLERNCDGAKDSGDAYTDETESDRPLTIRGAVSPATSGTVTVRREFGSKRSLRARIDPDGRFALPTLRLRKVANNSFILDFDAPPNAPRKAYFSAICLDCLAGAAPPSSAN